MDLNQNFRPNFFEGFYSIEFKNTNICCIIEMYTQTPPAPGLLLAFSGLSNFPIYSTVINITIATAVKLSPLKSNGSYQLSLGIAIPPYTVSVINITIAAAVKLSPLKSNGSYWLSLGIATPPYTVQLSISPLLQQSNFPPQV